MIDWSQDIAEPSAPDHTSRYVFELARELFVAEGGNKPPHKCINDAMLFMDEWRTFLCMDPARPLEGQGNLQGGS